MEIINQDVLGEILLYLNIGDIKSLSVGLGNCISFQSVKKNRNFWIKYLQLNNNTKHGLYLITLPSKCDNYVREVDNLFGKEFIKYNTYIYQKYKINLRTENIKYDDIFALSFKLDIAKYNAHIVYHKINDDILELMYEVKPLHKDLLDKSIDTLYMNLCNRKPLHAMLSDKLYYKCLQDLIQGKEMEIKTLQEKLNNKGDNIQNLLFNDPSFIVDSHKIRVLKDEIISLRNRIEGSNTSQTIIPFTLLLCNWYLISKDNVNSVLDTFEVLPVSEHIYIHGQWMIKFGDNSEIFYENK